MSTNRLGTGPTNQCSGRGSTGTSTLSSKPGHVSWFLYSADRKELEISPRREGKKPEAARPALTAKG